MATGALMGIGAAGVSAAAGTASSIASNRANANIQQMNNAFNERMLDKQMKYNTVMYERQLADQLQYSDPTFLRNRMEKAGYNAGVLSAGGNLGQAVSIPVAQGVTPPQAAHRTADYSGIGESIAGAADLIQRYRLSDSAAQKNSAEADNLRIEGKYIASRAIADLTKTLSEAKNNEARTVTEDLLRSLRKDMLESEKSLNVQQARNLAVARRGMIIQNTMDSTKLQFLPAQLRMQLANGAADIALKKAEQDLTSKQVEHEVQKMLSTIVSTQGKALENQFQSDSYRTRLGIVKRELFDLIYSADKFGLTKLAARMAETFGADMLK